MVVLPALCPLSVALIDVCPAGTTTFVLVQYANVSATVRSNVVVVALGLLSRMGTGVLEPRPTETVSRPNESEAGTEFATMTGSHGETIAPMFALIESVPVATPVTTPLEFTVAMLVYFDVHVNVPPAMNWPFESLPRAVSDTLPVGWILGEAGVSEIDASTCATLSKAEPVTPCAVAWIDVVPFAALSASARFDCIVSSPATDGFDEAHVNVMPAISAFSVSYAYALYARCRRSTRLKYSQPDIAYALSCLRETFNMAGLP